MSLRGKVNNPLYRNGLFSGYTEYRYGDRNSRVYDPRKRKGRRIVSPQKKRDELVRRIAILLDDWKSSPFEHEAQCRYGLRIAFCRRGHDWHRSDQEAEMLVLQALDKNGAQRPDWMEGQPEFTYSRDRCAYCGGPMDMDDATPGQRYCSPECARSALERRFAGAQVGYNIVRRSAYRLVSKSNATPRPCAHCGKDFRSDEPHVRHCSIVCANRNREAKQLQRKQCPNCGHDFQPRRETQQCCSLSCSSSYMHKQAREAASERACAVCNTSFKPSSASRRYCSRSCARRVSNLVQRLRKGNAQLNPWAFDYMFSQAA